MKCSKLSYYVYDNFKILSFYTLGKHKPSQGVKALADIFDMRKKKMKLSAAAQELGEEVLSDKDRVELELGEYLSSGLSILSGGADQLAWWRDSGNSMFPTLARLARRYFTMNATSVASERLFSLSDHIVSKKRASMKDDTVNRMVFLASNLD